MKKVLFLSLGMILMLTGCGAGATNTMSCSYEVKNGTLTTKTKYDVNYEGKEIKKVRITYDYKQNTVNDTDGDGKKDIDGVGTGTDGTTNDTQKDNDGIIDGVIGSAIDKVIQGTSAVILDVAGIKSRHATVQSTYGNIAGFSVQNTTDTDNNYIVNYLIDYDKISDTDLNTLNLSRDINTFRDNYTKQGYTCK